MTCEEIELDEAIKEFEKFVAEERNLYSENDNNLVAFAFGQVGRYLRFLFIAEQRYIQISEEVSASFWARMESDKGKQGHRILTEEEVAQLENEQKRLMLLHYEIESYYLFLKILLDKCAQFVENYFGSERGMSLTSHHKWCTAMNSFVESKGITLPENMAALMTSLHTEASEYRDKGIAHQRNPRTMHGTSILRNGKTQISASTLYPRDTDKSIQSPSVPEITIQLQEYIRCLCKLIEDNRDKTRYSLKE